MLWSHLYPTCRDDPLKFSQNALGEENRSDIRVADFRLWSIVTLTLKTDLTAVCNEDKRADAHADVCWTYEAVRIKQADDQKGRLLHGFMIYTEVLAVRRSMNKKDPCFLTYAPVRLTLMLFLWSSWLLKSQMFMEMFRSPCLAPNPEKWLSRSEPERLKYHSVLQSEALSLKSSLWINLFQPVWSISMTSHFSLDTHLHISE